MGSKSNGKKNKKERNSGQGRRNVRQPVVTTVVTRVVPVTPIPALTVLPSQPELKTVSAGDGEGVTVKKWCFDSTPVYRTPEESWPSTSLTKGTVVELTGNKQKTSAADIKTSWSEVAYEIPAGQAGMQWVTGWVNDAYLDDYSEKFPDSGVVIPNQTPNPRDAQQYMLLDGIVRYNLCGELCVAFIVNDDIDSVLAKWKKNSPGSYNGILGAGRDKGTSEYDLKNMLGAVLSEYGYGSNDDQVLSLSSKLTYPVTPAGLLEDLNKMLTTHYLIGGVTINDMGELIGKENPRIKHWVVVDRIKRNGHRVEMYNPFPNKREEYSFGEFYSSFSTNSGVWVKRKRARSASPVEDLPVFQVAIDNPNPLYRAAQYIDVEGRKKTNLCGEFCVAFIVNQSINAVLERWKEVQPILYADIVGNNKGTGTFSLGTILKAYGYNTEGDFMDFTTGLMDPFLKKSLASPGRIAKMLETHFLIAGVNIDGATGLLKPGDNIRHWVVVDKLTPIGKNRGWVELYNPFFNRWEEYSYKQFINSAGYWSGLWVKRNIVPVYVEQVVQDVTTEDKPRKDQRIGQWTEEQLVAFIRRMGSGAKPINKVADQLAKQSGWKKKDIVAILKKLARAGQTWIWTETKLRGEMQRRLEKGIPVNKISAELAKQSGWKKREVLSVLKKLIQSQKWAEEQLLAAIREKRKTVKSTNKIVAELATRSGWKKRDVLSILKKLIVAEKWTEEQLLAAIREKRKTVKSINKIAAELVKRSGWKQREVLSVLKKLIVAEKWTEEQLLAALREKRKTVKSTNKIAAELAKRSGWKQREVLSVLKKLIAAEKWTEEQLLVALREKRKTVKSTNKIAAELAKRSGWKQREVLSVLKKLIAAEKWTEEQLLAAIREKRNTVKSTNKIAAELAKQSGWKQHEILSRIKKLIIAEKWIEPHLRAEIERRLEFGTAVNKLSSELAGISGWKKWEISKMVKKIRKEQEVSARKADAKIAEEPVIVVDPETIINASKPLAEFVEWQKSLLSETNSKLYKVRKWGDPVMKKYGFDVDQVNTTNFQAVGLYNDGNKEFGAISNFIRISHSEVMKLKAMQIEDNYVAKRKDWRSQKMNWLCKFRGTIYFFDEPSDQWQSAPRIRWGTLALGGNMVQVLGTEMIQAKFRDGVIRKVEMARLQGFRTSDWSRPLDELLAEGLVHRCFCAYKSNHFGDSPKGIVYSPFFSVRNRDFAGLATPMALYIPVEWLEPKD